MKIEKRTFILESKYKELLLYFNQESEKSEIENQIIYNYHTEGDFKIIRTNKYIKMELVENNINNKNNEVMISPKYDNQLLEMFLKLGISVTLKRYRIRNKFIYKNFFITLDDNIKYGFVLRIRCYYNNEAEKQIKLEAIKDLLEGFSIIENKLEEFNERYAKYRTSWYELTKNINDEDFLKQ